MHSGGCSALLVHLPYRTLQPFNKPTCLGLPLMISLYESLNRLVFQGPGPGQPFEPSGWAATTFCFRRSGFP